MADLRATLGPVVCVCGHEWDWATQAERSAAAWERNDSLCASCGHKYSVHFSPCFGATTLDEPLCECGGFTCGGHAPAKGE